MENSFLQVWCQPLQPKHLILDDSDTKAVTGISLKCLDFISFIFFLNGFHMVHTIFLRTKMLFLILPVK